MVKKETLEEKRSGNRLTWKALKRFSTNHEKKMNGLKTETILSIKWNQNVFPYCY